MALGMARERWLQAWERAGMTRRRVVNVQPGTWRARVIPGAGREREGIRERELMSARAECGGVEIGPDEAAAILISRWATRAEKVAELHGVRRRA